MSEAKKGISEGEEQFVFGSLLTLNIFFIATILYLVTGIHNGTSIGNAWVYATVISLTIAVALRIASNFIGKGYAAISYICLIISLVAQLYTIGVLLAALA
jgi:glucan phosphoethanolaminetransferase (alkaline phosphatase superfamily)